MKLKRGEIRPGIVLKVVDEYGTIKGSCVGLFSTEDDIEMLPPMYPFIKTSPSQFSKPNVGDKIWVMFFSDNPQELFYFFQGDVQNTIGKSLASSSGDISKFNNNNNVLMKCDSGFNGAELSFSNEEGWKMQNDESQFTISKEGDIEIKNGNGSINMDVDGVHLSGTNHTVARGDVVMDKLNNIETMMKLFAKTLQGVSFTSAAGTSLEGLIETYLGDNEEVESPNVTTA